MENTKENMHIDIVVSLQLISLLCADILKG